MELFSRFRRKAAKVFPALEPVDPLLQAGKAPEAPVAPQPAGGATNVDYDKPAYKRVAPSGPSGLTPEQADVVRAQKAAAGVDPALGRAPTPGPAPQPAAAGYGPSLQQSFDPTAPNYTPKGAAQLPNYAKPGTARANWFNNAGATAGPTMQKVSNLPGLRGLENLANRMGVKTSASWADDAAKLAQGTKAAAPVAEKAGVVRGAINAVKSVPMNGLRSAGVVKGLVSAPAIAVTAGTGGAIDGFQTDTASYAKRMGLDYDPTDTSFKGVAQDVGTRIAGVFSDVGNHAINGLSTIVGAASAPVTWASDKLGITDNWYDSSKELMGYNYGDRNFADRQEALNQARSQAPNLLQQNPGVVDSALNLARTAYPNANVPSTEAVVGAPVAQQAGTASQPAKPAAPAAAPSAPAQGFRGGMINAAPSGASPAQLEKSENWQAEDPAKFGAPAGTQVASKQYGKDTVRMLRGPDGRVEFTNVGRYADRASTPIGVSDNLNDDGSRFDRAASDAKIQKANTELHAAKLAALDGQNTEDYLPGGRFHSGPESDFNRTLRGLRRGNAADKSLYVNYMAQQANANAQRASGVVSQQRLRYDMMKDQRDDEYKRDRDATSDAFKVAQDGLAQANESRKQRKADTDTRLKSMFSKTVDGKVVEDPETMNDFLARMNGTIRAQGKNHSFYELDQPQQEEYLNLYRLRDRFSKSKGWLPGKAGGDDSENLLDFKPTAIDGDPNDGDSWVYLGNPSKGRKIQVKDLRSTDGPVGVLDLEAFHTMADRPYGQNLNGLRRLQQR